jgi:hypothetical protein
MGMGAHRWQAGIPSVQPCLACLSWQVVEACDFDRLGASDFRGACLETWEAALQGLTSPWWF